MQTILFRKLLKLNFGFIFQGRSVAFCYDVYFFPMLHVFMKCLDLISQNPKLRLVQPINGPNTKLLWSEYD